MRHLRSILYALVLAPAVWILSGVGFTHDLTGRARDNGAVESLTGLLLLVLAGAAYAIVVFAPISPAGPALFGLVFFGVSVWALAAPSAYADAWPAGVTKEGFDLSRPGYGLAAMLAVPLICTALSSRRWERYEPPVIPLLGTLGRSRGTAAVAGTPIASVTTEILDTAGSPALAGRPSRASSRSSSPDPDTEALVARLMALGSGEETAVLPTPAAAAADAKTAADGDSATDSAGGDSEAPTVDVANSAKPAADAGAAGAAQAVTVRGKSATGESDNEPTVAKADKGAAKAGEQTAAAAAEPAARTDERTAAIETDEPTATVKTEEPTAAVTTQEPTAAVTTQEPTAAVTTEEPTAAVTAEEPTAAVAAKETDASEGATAEVGPPATADPDATTKDVVQAAPAGDPDMATKDVAQPASAGDSAAIKDVAQPVAAGDPEAATKDVAAPEPSSEVTDAVEREHPGEEQTEPVEVVAATPADSAEAVTETVAFDEPEDAKTQVIQLPTGDRTTRDVTRKPGEGPTHSIDDGGRTMVIGPDQRTQVIHREAAEETQVIDLARLRTREIDGAKTQVISTVEPPGDHTQVLNIPTPGEPSPDQREPEPQPQPQPSSIVGEERPDPAADPTTRIEPDRRPGDKTTVDVGSGKRIMTVTNQERPADEASDDTRRTVRPPIPSQRRRDGS